MAVRRERREEKRWEGGREWSRVEGEKARSGGAGDTERVILWKITLRLRSKLSCVRVKCGDARWRSDPAINIGLLLTTVRMCLVALMSL